MNLQKKDIEILRGLAEEIACIAALPVQQENRKLWTACNDLKMQKPMVLMYAIPWHEMNFNDELTLQCAHESAKAIEDHFRKQIYQWKHMPGDMVVEPVITSPMAIEDTGILEVNMNTLTNNRNGGIKSQHFNIQIQDEDDIEKIRMPVVTQDEKKTQETFGYYQDIFGGILQVRKGFKYSTGMRIWDELIKWTGVQEALMDLALRPDYVHKICERLINAHLYRLKQYEELGLIGPCNNDQFTGNGGYGYTDELPVPEEKRDTQERHLWEGSMAQIFTEVSPQMHEEFALEYEKRYLNRFGLVYYGCCEALHNKVEILRKHLPNLRKISCSPWANIEKMAAQCGTDLVVSVKPNPALVAWDRFDPEAVRSELKTILEKTRGCNVEIILKTIGTVRHEPQRLWQWAQIAREVVDGM